MGSSEIKRKDVEVRISRRTLWVDATAYPLAHVTKIMPLEVKVRRGRVFVAYVRETGAWLGLGFAGLVLLGCLRSSVPAEVFTGYAIVLAVALVAVTVRLVRRLSFGTFHVLSIGIAGTQQAAVASRDKQVISRLAQRVIEAIDDPAMEYAIHIENFELNGDMVGGDQHRGDVVFGSKFTSGSS
jgi:hypothetical protein